MHANERLAREEMEALSRGDLEGALACYTDDVVFHYPGRNPLAGTYKGKEGLREFFTRAGELLGGSEGLRRDLHDVLASDDHVVQLVEVSAERHGRLHRWHGVVVLHARDGKLSECWVHIDDQHALDEFLSS